MRLILLTMSVVMKRYPSISQRLPKRYRTEPLFIFDKIDGSNLRFEWNRELGWHRWGTRTQIIDESHDVFGSAWSLFRETLGEPLEFVAYDQRWSSMTVFAEFWGPRSFAGQHEPDDPKQLTLLDVAPYKQGFLAPELFMEWFGSLDLPAFLGQFPWDHEFLEQVNSGNLQGITEEGVVGKASGGHRRVMVKAKTQAWKAKVLEKYGTQQGSLLLQS